MNPVSHLIAFGLRQLIGDTADPIVQAVENRFTDHGKALPDALARANDQAWQALAVALAGDGWFDSIKVFFASGDAKGVREEVRRLLDGLPVPFAGTRAEFRQACLTDLKKARKAGALAADRLDVGAVARRAADFRRYTDPEGLIDGARQAVASVGDALAADYPNLATLLRQPTPEGPPLLAAAFGYFFRREVETDAELAHGLTFDGLRRLAAHQETAFGEIGKALEELGGRFDEVLEGLGRIEAVVVETHGAVLDLHAEMQRLGGLHLGSTRRFVGCARRCWCVSTGPGCGKARFGPTTASRSAVRTSARRSSCCWSASGSCRPISSSRRPPCSTPWESCQIGTGDYAQARQTFGEVAEVVKEDAGRAEARYNAYRAALEERRWDAALLAIQEAAALDPQRFAPFPLRRYRPARILGAGGFGAAFLCRDQNFEEDVVVKTLHAAELARNLKDVFREAVLLRRLSHPAVIGVRDCEFADPERQTRPYIVMDYFDGPSLEAYLHEHDAMGLNDLLPVRARLRRRWRRLTRRDILHRDLKPDNVLVRKGGDGWRVKVIDFGLAIRRETVETSKAHTAAHPTILGDSIAGTVAFAPPEQMGRLRGVKPGPYSDVYSFGKVCCYALFKTTEPKRRHLNALPHDLADLLDRCTDQDLKHRPPSFETVLKVLGDPALLEQQSSEATARRRAEAERRTREEAEKEQAQREAEEQRRLEQQAWNEHELEERLADNLRRWKRSGQPASWVEARQGAWNDADWLALMQTLKQSEFWPMNLGEVGKVLQGSKQDRLERMEAEQRRREEEAKRQAEERRRQEQMEAHRRAEEERRQRWEAERRQREEQERKQAEAEQARRQADFLAEQARRRAEEEQRRRSQEEAERKRAEEAEKQRQNQEAASPPSQGDAKEQPEPLPASGLRTALARLYCLAVKKELEPLPEPAFRAVLAAAGLVLGAVAFGGVGTLFAVFAPPPRLLVVIAEASYLVAAILSLLMCFGYMGTKALTNYFGSAISLAGCLVGLSLAGQLDKLSSEGIAPAPGRWIWLVQLSWTPCSSGPETWLVALCWVYGVTVGCAAGLLYAVRSGRPQ